MRSRYGRLLALLVLVAGLATAGTVYVTPHGKTYHLDRQCLALSKSARVLTADDAAARAHGLRECGICAHRHRGGAGAGGGKKSNEEFAK